MTRGLCIQGDSASRVGSASRGSAPGGLPLGGVCIQGGLHPGGSASRGSLHPGVGLHPGGSASGGGCWNTTGYGQQAGSTHPTYNILVTDVSALDFCGKYIRFLMRYISFLVKVCQFCDKPAYPTVKQVGESIILEIHLQ